MIIVILSIASIIVLVELTSEPFTPVPREPIKSLNESHILQSPAPEEESKAAIGEVEEYPNSKKEEAMEEQSSEPDGEANRALSPDAQEDTPEHTAAPVGYDAIVDRHQEQLIDLQASCQGALLTVYWQYASSDDKAERRELMRQGRSEVARCDARFEGILHSLNESLTTNNYPTTIISTYRAEYAQQKALAQSMLD
jgi:hypothetical protein